MSDLIEIRQVTKVFGKGASEVHAFGPVDLAIGAGQFVSLLGPSGCGKSTLMLMLAGLLERSTGTISISGKEVTGPQTDIGIMFQDNTLVPWRTVRGNVELQLELRGLPPKLHAERVMGISRTLPSAIPMNCRAACSSVRRSVRRWFTIPGSCSWTNPWENSTP
jgi:NitT/TauT family transport system ATP-binding protein